MCHAWRLAAVLALAALPAVGGADAAQAGMASGRPARFAAAAGERNVLTLDAGSAGWARFSDAGAPVGAGPWCAPLPPGQALCDPDGDPRDTDGGGVGVELGDGDDRAIIRWIPGTDTRPGVLRLSAGPGDDNVESTANGLVRFDGGDGDDRLVTGPSAGAYFVGGAGADFMASGPGCCAVVGYEDHDAAGVHVTLDATPDDGAAGEGDDAIDATLRGGDAPAGRDGPDAVTCGAGDDVVAADADDTVAVDCERIRVGVSAGPELTLDMSARAGRSGTVPLVYRVRFPNPDNALSSRSTFRLVDGRGRPASSTATFVLGGQASVARLRITLSRAARRRLAHSRSGALALIAQRVSRAAGPGSTASGYEQFNSPVTIRRTGRRS